MRHFIGGLVLFFLALSGAGFADETTAPEVAEADREAIQTIIRAQLDAFRADDAKTAFSFASPAIQDQFGGPDRFMTMVKAGYGSVYDNREFFFQETLKVRGVVAQKVLIVDRSNTSVVAVYPMQQQADGSWRIDGCYLSKDSSQML